MASREEEKRRRREQRLAEEQEAATTARRRRLLRTAGAALAAVLIVGIIIAIAASSGRDGGQGTGSSSGSAKPVALAAPRESDLRAAAAKAGCVLRDFPNFGQQHTANKVSYKSSPPTSGPHNPQPAQDGAYAPGNPPALGQSVHALEHGRVELQWRPGVATRTIGELQALFNEQSGFHTLLFANQTKMPYTVAASAWQHFIGCKNDNAATFDALRAFRKKYTDKAPEQVP